MSVQQKFSILQMYISQYLFVLLFTDNSEEPPATAAKEEETEESDHKGKSVNIE